MKRLLPVLLYLVLVALITGMFMGPSPKGSPDGADPLKLTAVNDTAYMLVNGRTVVDVVANDEDSNAGCFTFQFVQILAGPFHSNLKFRDSTYIDRREVEDPGDDVLVYVPFADFVGKDSLKYEVHSVDDGCPNTIDSAWVFIYITQAPDAEDDILQVMPEARNELDVLANDTDPDGEPLTVDSLGVLPAHGDAEIVNTGGTPAQLIAYTPDDDYIGPDSIQYFMSDDKRAVDSAWVWLTVNAQPVALDDSATTLPGDPITIDVLSNDSDPEGGALTIAGIESGPSNGNVTVNGVITYTPNAGFAGIDMFTYSIVDPLGGTDTGLVVVFVNTAPVAEDDVAFGAFNNPVVINVLANDTDADGDGLSVVGIIEEPENGSTEVIDSGQRIRYTPDEGFFGTDRFVYEAADGRGGADQAAVTVTVSAIAALQLIHNALPFSAVDVYVDDQLVWDDLNFRAATPFLDVPAGMPKVDVTEAAAADNSAPFFTTMLDLTPEATYIAIATGVAGQNFDLLIKEDARLAAADSNSAEFFIVHGVLDAPASGIDVHLLDPNDSNLPSLVLADDINFEEMTPYQAVPPAVQNIDATNFNGSMQYDAYQFDLTGLRGQTFTLVLSGLLDPQPGDSAFTLIGFDALGRALQPAIVTAAEDVTEVPQEFVLQGNYPNPFNPTTTVVFDLPEAARVSIVIVDVLGRVVLTQPARAVEAGAARALEIDAGSLASGTYFYRLTAQTPTDTMVRTGQMLLIK